jgi:hypothetical protein
MAKDRLVWKFTTPRVTDPRIAKVKASLQDSVQYVAIAN